MLQKIYLKNLLGSIKHDNNNHTRPVHPDRCTDRRTLHLNVMTDYKAEPEEWKVVQMCCDKGLSSTDCCLLELRSRIERLELGAGIRDVVAKEVRQSYPEKLNRSLVQRVADEIAVAEGGWENEACAAIREVATWMRERGGWNQSTVADVLEKELNE
jgi:hypothetical protein